MPTDNESDPLVMDSPVSSKDFAVKPAQCLAVMYHYVRDRSDTPDAAIRGLSPDRFIEQIDALCRHLEPIDWPTLDAWKSRRATVPERCFLLTFDDALSDHADVVAPILESRGLRGAFFVSAGPLTTGNVASAHAVHILLARIGADRLESEVSRWLAKRGIKPQADERRDAGAALDTYHYEKPKIARLKFMLSRRIPRGLRQAMLDELLEAHGSARRECYRNWYVDLPQLEDLQATGHTIGGHGYQHEPYTEMTRLQQSKDIARTARFLREALGERRRPFSYPFGDFDDHVVKLLRGEGFVQAFTTQQQWIRRGSDDFRLGRCDTIHVDQFLQEQLLCLSR